MGEEVAVSVSDDVPSPPTLSEAAINQNFSYMILLLRSFVICMFAYIRIELAVGDENHSVFDNKGVYRILFLIGEIGVAHPAFALFLQWDRPMRDIGYTIFKFIGSFSAFLAPFSLMIVLVLPPKLNSIGYLLVCVMFGIVVTCFYLDDQQQEKKSSVLSVAVPYIIAALILGACMIPTDSKRIAYVIYGFLWMENSYHLITYLMFIVEKTKTGKPSDSEDHKPIENNYPRNNYLEVLGRN